jgi:putative endonuclease
MSRQARGQWGEEQAARWYVNAGYQIVDRNWRVKAGEIDLIVCRGRLVVFVEVKARATDRFGDPACAVTASKQLRLRRLGAQWLAEAEVRGVDIRFDVVSILGVDIRVIEGAF